MPDRIDFAAIAAAALSAADRMVPRWLPAGSRKGAEWVAPNPTRGDRHAGSFSVNLNTGAWGDFASGDKGGDLISLRAYLTGQSQLAAAKEIAEDLHMSAASSAPAPVQKKRSEWTPVVPVPEDAPATEGHHYHYGRPQALWAYRGADGALLGYVRRFATSDGGKEIVPLVWARNEAKGRAEWRDMQWPVPRPLYGLERLRDGRTVLVVEGEKCVDAAREVLGEALDVVTWPGGGNAVDRADWSVLRGRKVIIWPDCDDARDKRTGELLEEARQPGTKAAERAAARLVELGCDVRIVQTPAPGTKPSGWDVADAVAEGAGAAELREIITQLRKPACMRQEAPAASPAARADEEEGGGWEATLLRRRGDLVACLANVVKILLNRAEWRGVIAQDEFAARTVKRRPAPGGSSELGEWTDADTTAVRIWLTEQYNMVMGAQDVDAAIELVAKANAFHPVREYLDSLTWDGESRIDAWLIDYMSVPPSEYACLVARWFLMGMCARVRTPGAKFDFCLVLEGTQGLRKSTALRVLAGDWFSDTELDLTNKDALSSIRGKWIHEFGEMGSLARAESTRQKSFLSRQVDEFRPPYGRREIRAPRQLVFAGTTNEWQWQKDPTGGRRFWPIDVQGEIDTEGLAAVRDQLLAEADHRYQAGERFWPTAEEQRTLFDPEQLRRESEDGFFDAIHDWLEELTRPEFTMGDLLTEALKLDAGRITRDVTTRVGSLLKKLECGRKEKRNGVSRFVYTVPAWSAYGKAQQRAAAGREDRDGSPIPF